MSKLILEDGTEISDPNDILKEQKKFYETLYKENLKSTSREYRQSEQHFLNRQ
jgi:hypothetical protein